MKYSILIIALLSILVVACQPSNPDAELLERMEGMPCHQMPDGSWMGDCGVEEMQEHMRGQDMMDNSGVTASGGMSTNGFDLKKDSAIIEVSEGDVVTLKATPVKSFIAGQEIVMWGYNGMVPGPVFKGKQGTTFTVEFTNDIPWNTTVHWHGLRHANEDDGVPGVTQPPVAYGQSHTYTISFPDDGVFWYHPHVREDLQQDLGLAGNMLVVPAGWNYNPVNREELLVLDDILIGSEGVVPYGEDHANFALMGRFGNVMLLNGQEGYELVVSKGEIIRFYITNVANVRPFNLSFSGARMKLVGSDLGLYENEEYVDSVVIAPAERYIVEVFFEDKGVYDIQNINPHKTYDLGKIVVSETTVEEDHSSIFNKLSQVEQVRNDIQSFSDDFNKEPDYILELTVDMPMDSMMEGMPCHQMPNGLWMGDCDGEEAELHLENNIEWEDNMAMMNSRMTSEHVTWIIEDTISGKQNMDFRINAKVGDVIKIRLNNTLNSPHPMQHPIHLHGQRFVITHIDGEPVNNKVWKDTVLVPIGSTIDILVDVTNPGMWMMHCHIAEHLEAGMMTDFMVME